MRIITTGEFAADSSVSAKTDADLLTFNFTHHDPALAARLATEYARQYIAYRTQLDTQALAKARTQVQDRITQLELGGDTKSALYASLVERDQQLQTMQALQTSNASLVREAQGASKVQPRPPVTGSSASCSGSSSASASPSSGRRSTRVRTSDEVAEIARTFRFSHASPSRRGSIRERASWSCSRTRSGVQAESFRMLRTNLEFANLERGRADDHGDERGRGGGQVDNGRQPRSRVRAHGKRVDPRRPRPASPVPRRFFGLGRRPGLTDVALGHVDLDEALPRARSPTSRAARPHFGERNRQDRRHGSRCSAPARCRPTPASSWAAVVDEILEELAGRADLVLIDAPPLLHVGDAMALTAKVDAVAARHTAQPPPPADPTELRRPLEAAPASRSASSSPAPTRTSRYGDGYSTAPTPATRDGRRESRRGGDRAE